MIANTVIEVSNERQAVVNVAEDIDLLNIFLKWSRGKIDQNVHNSQGFKYPTLQKYLCLDAFSGCYHIGILQVEKKKFVKTPENHVEELFFARRCSYR